MAQFKRGDRVFICQVGIPENGEWCRVVGTAKVPYSGTWYRFRRENERKSAGTIAHESWLNRDVPESNGFAQAV